MPEILLYTKNFCSYCVWAKRLLDAKGVSYRELNVNQDERLRKEMVERSGGRRTAPQVFVDGKNIGGYAELHALEQKGDLDALLGGSGKNDSTQEETETGGVENVVILGSGSAGLTAGIYTGRANLNPLVVEGKAAGGQLTLTTDVENFPGFPTGVMGPNLIAEMRKQAERFGTRFTAGDATEVDLSQTPFTLTLSGRKIRTRTLIVATGADARLMGLESERKLIGHGVSTCATCDGFFFREKEILVIGGGDSAMEEATFLTKFAAKVTVVHRRDKLRASKIMQEKAIKNPKVAFIWDSVLEEIRDPEKGRVEGALLRNVKTGETREVRCDGIFLAIGHVPNTRIFEKLLEMADKGYIVTGTGTATSVKGVFAAGDVADHVYRQAITAAGTGCMAAIDAERYLESLES